MPIQNIAVTPEATAALRQMAEELQLQRSQLKKECTHLQEIFDENQQGLGPHAESLRRLLALLEENTSLASNGLTKMAMRLNTAAKVRSLLLEDGNSYAPTASSGSDAADILGRIYDDNYRRRRMPRETTNDGQIRGSWQGNVFCLSDSFVPSSCNPGGLTFGQLKQQLADQYGIHYTGTPFAGGYADFSGVAVAQVGLEEIVDANLKQNPGLFDPVKGIDFETIYSRRDVNFALADEIAAAKQLPIPGLVPGYTADELKQWRSKHGFSWDESFQNGYLLVPAIIHGNTGHTGLVSVGTHGSDAEANFAARHMPPI